MIQVTRTSHDLRDSILALLSSLCYSCIFVVQRLSSLKSHKETYRKILAAWYRWLSLDEAFYRKSLSRCGLLDLFMDFVTGL